MLLNPARERSPHSGYRKIVSRLQKIESLLDALLLLEKNALFEYRVCSECRPVRLLAHLAMTVRDRLDIPHNFKRDFFAKAGAFVGI